MPIRGAKPKAEGQARHRVKSDHDWIAVPNVPYDGPVPPLPRRRGGWPARAKRKWKVWSTMPHCRLWNDGDWDFAIDSLEVAARFYEGDSVRASELRTREKQLGTTLDYRRDLRIKYIDSTLEQEEIPTEDVPNIDDYRDRVG